MLARKRIDTDKWKGGGEEEAVDTEEDEEKQDGGEERQGKRERERERRSWYPRQQPLDAIPGFQKEK